MTIEKRMMELEKKVEQVLNHLEKNDDLAVVNDDKLAEEVRLANEEYFTPKTVFKELKLYEDETLHNMDLTYELKSKELEEIELLISFITWPELKDKVEALEKLCVLNGLTIQKMVRELE